MSIIFTVPQNHAVVITRFGKFSRVASQGLQFKIPFLDKIHSVSNWGGIANKNEIFIELSEQNIDTAPRECHTKDNVAVSIDASIYWRIISIQKAVFEVDHLPSSLVDTCLNSLRSNIGKHSLDEVLQSRKSLNDKVSVDLKDIANKWGVQISRVELKEFTTSDETAEAMRQEMTAERMKRATVIEAEGKAAAVIKTAEASAKAIKLKADAETEYMSKLSSVIGKENLANILISDKIMEAYKDISRNPAHKVFLPSNIKTLITDEITN